MISIKSLAWSNWFSYGEDNFIDFENAKLIQVMGVNGVGKTSIPLIIEEVLYNKNSKGIKKQSLLNRYLDKAELKAVLIFEKDSDKYKIELSRKSTLKLKLEKNGEDISSHTATNTYKSIEAILGMDFKTFTQLIYQSSKSNLEFLTATDTNRKKFLISLFNLERYLQIHEEFKKVYTRVNTTSANIEGKISTFESWIKSHENDDFNEIDVIEVPEMDSSLTDRLANLKSQISTIAKTNANINKNNQYKEILKSLDTSILSKNIVTDPKEKEKLIENGKRLRDEKVGLESHNKQEKLFLNKLSKLGNKCATCEQDIDTKKTEMIITNTQEVISNNEKQIARLDNALKIVRADLDIINKKEKELEEKRKVSDELVRLTNLIDEELPEETLDEGTISNEIFEITQKIESSQRNINSIIDKNSKASAHNSKIKVIKEQLQDYNNSLELLREEAAEVSDMLNRINILKKAFSTTGLLNYKVEYLVKDLEAQINNYLGDLSSGKFQLIFVLDKDKLNIEIIDDGMTVSIEELSAGELARINASTLLAIRKLMAAISSTKINILFLDEIMGVLDADGKEKLIEVLNNEKELNTLLVSHEFSHPLIPKINIVKEDKISRLEDG